MHIVVPIAIKKASHFCEALIFIVAGEIEISNHSIENLFELEAFIKTHAILLIAS
jgi:hypothetical protein